MERVYEKRIWKFRGEEYEYIHTAWLCTESGEQFTTDVSDTAGYLQVTNQYREKYGIPYTDEIIGIRRKYGISAAKMSLILGIGVNQYRLYEQGEVPSVSNGRMIRSIMNPKVMLELVESSRNELSESEYSKIVAKVKDAIACSDNYKLEQYEINRVFSTKRGAENGYACLSLDRLRNILLFILERCSNVWYTKMNKLLFYADFVSFRDRGMALTGLSYRAIDFGPVPEKWDKVYSEFSDVSQEFSRIGDYVGTVLMSSAKPDLTLFSADEIEVLERVCERFGADTSAKISRQSHEETAWLDHITNNERIPFREAFKLKAL